MVKPLVTDSLRKQFGISSGSLEVMAATLRASEAWKSASLFPTVTSLRSIVTPLDKELFRPTGPTLIGEELRAASDQISSIMLGRTIGSAAALSASRLMPMMPSESIQRATQQITQLYSAQFGMASIAESWNRPLLRFADGMQRFIEEQRRIDEQTDEFVKAHGWPVPLHLPFRAYRRVVSLARAGKRQVNRAMQEGFRPGTQAFSSTAEVLLTSPRFASRRPIVRQSLAAYRKRQWYLVINGLLPMVEGVLVEYAYPDEPPPRSASTRKAIEQLREREGKSLVIAVDTLETLLLSAGANVALFEPFDPGRYGVGGEPRALNRHAILHGAARRYGTEQNALRLLLLLAVMAEGFDLA